MVLDDHAGRTDGYGNELVVTAPALADELAGAAELAQGKLAGRPFALVRGRADLVLPPGEDGPGAAALVRVEGEDLFGYGAREAVVRALAGDPADLVPFGAPASAEEMAAAVRAGARASRPSRSRDGLAVRRGPPAGAAGVRARLASESEEGPEKAVIRPVTP